jgi:hypothetical protein
LEDAQSSPSDWQSSTPNTSIPGESAVSELLPIRQVRWFENISCRSSKFEEMLKKLPSPVDHSPLRKAATLDDWIVSLRSTHRVRKIARIVHVGQDRECKFSTHAQVMWRSFSSDFCCQRTEDSSLSGGVQSAGRRLRKVSASRKQTLK